MAGRALTAMLALAAVLAGSGVAQACTAWNASGSRDLRQSNGFLITLTIDKWGTIADTGNKKFFTGHANYRGGSGRVTGNVTPNQLWFVIYWKGGSIGQYYANIDAEGYLGHGTTYDQNDPSSTATWSSTRPPLKCDD